jgi:hypothetical protein
MGKIEKAIQHIEKAIEQIEEEIKVTLMYERIEMLEQIKEDAKKCKMELKASRYFINK